MQLFLAEVLVSISLDQAESYTLLVTTEVVYHRKWLLAASAGSVLWHLQPWKFQNWFYAASKKQRSCSHKLPFWPCLATWKKTKMNFPKTSLSVKFRTL